MTAWNLRQFGTLIIAISGYTMTHAKIVTEPFDYTHEGVTCKGHICFDDAQQGKRPGVLVVHEWWGCNEFARARAAKVAELGYVALAVDMYGDGETATTAEAASKLAGKVSSDPALIRARAKAAFDAFKAHPRVDSSKIGAIGFCFGGSTCLHIAYSGLDVKGVVSFHGNPFPPTEAEAAQIKAKVLVLHGAADTLVPDERIAAFQDGMRKSKADWQLITYGNAKHSFTNPASTALNMNGVGYDAAADARSWEDMKQLFAEAFQE
jgi:dienelactone hydrolase